jgi:hypothetical protein
MPERLNRLPQALFRKGQRVCFDKLSMSGVDQTNIRSA